ncbi:hypothetical protein ACUXV3_03840 [Roseobacteraceae bacterium NS-SX3]
MISIFFVALGVVSANAADFEIISLEPVPFHEVSSGSCNVRMTGLIAPGDAQKLFKVGQQLGEEVRANEALKSPELQLDSGLVLFRKDLDNQIRRRASIDDKSIPKFNALCLSSPGGSMEEALKLIREVMTFGFVTVVPENAECFSACAFVFLAGDLAFSGGELGEIMPFRIMHASSKLGFHAPSARLDPRFPPIPIEQLNSLLTSVFIYLRDFDAFFIDRDTIHPDTRFSKDLYAEVLRHLGPESFYMIDTVDKAGRFNIRVAGLSQVSITESSLARLCSNHSTWRRGLSRPLANDLRFSTYTIFRGVEEYSCGADGCEVEPGVYRIETPVFLCEVTYSPSIYGDDFLITTEYIGSPFRGAVYYSSDPWSSFPHYYPLHLTTTDTGQIGQNPYLLDGLASNIFDPSHTGEATLITGFENDSSSPFGFLIWRTGEAKFFWMDDQAGIQGELYDVEIKSDEQKLCIVWGADSRPYCSTVACQSGRGCVFRPDERRALAGFPYLARPIFFGPTDDFVNRSLGVTPSVVLPDQ